MAVVAIVITVALRVAGLVRVLDVFGKLALCVVRNWQLAKWIPGWRLEWGNGGRQRHMGARQHGSTATEVDADWVRHERTGNTCRRRGR